MPNPPPWLNPLGQGRGPTRPLHVVSGASPTDVQQIHSCNYGMYATQTVSTQSPQACSIRQ
jgi:hypothetical protein